MTATNELSCYRYAAVLYTKCQDGEQLNIHKVEKNEWVDFMAQRMDRQSLLELLQGSANDSLVAISNIPHSKTILERHIVDSMDNQTIGAPRRDGWLQSLCRSCRLLSVTLSSRPAGACPADQIPSRDQLEPTALTARWTGCYLPPHPPQNEGGKGPLSVPRPTMKGDQSTG